MRKMSKLALALSSFLLLAGCTDAEYFKDLKTIHHVEVIDIDSHTKGKVSYTEVAYKYKGKKYERDFVSSEDQGLEDYYNSVKLFKDKIYLDLVLDRNKEIVVATLSEEGN